MLLMETCRRHVRYTNPTSVAGDGECAAGRVLCPEGLCCSNEGFCGDTDAYCLPENYQSQCRDYPPPSSSAVDVSDIITKSVFDQLIPNRDFITCPAHGFYTYEAFLTAARRFPEFGNFGNNETRTREIAAFFAQTSTKTTGKP
ncbi:hypothetical protein TIFTF001_048925 [Ficus carica]|uniref:chitinase n=1 Tax=Ficus carica TaxID=3494 RepID=A0AA88CM70_FICCA|nr:hypothetical protein TIFTF001_048925 [Ficus carica]